MKRLTLHMICLAALAAPVYADTAATRPSAPICPIATELQTEVIAVAPKCVATTVGLVSKEGDPSMPSIASGSGVIISADGLIMTAGHVIDKPGNALTIRFSDGRVFKGVAVGLDHATDTGLAKITDPAPASGWEFADIAPDDSAHRGDWVLATGNPGSIVLDRNPPLRFGRVISHDGKTIQTNCALEPGDSGGPVFDLQGRVVAINSRILASRGAEVAPREYLSMHVPVSLFTTEWKEMLAGMNAHPEVTLGRSQQGPNGPARARTSKAALLRQAIAKLVADKDPEVLKMLSDAQASGQRTPMTPEMMDHFIQKAGLSPAASTQPAAGKPEVAAAPTTKPTTAPAVVAEAAPATQPTTRPAAKGIAAAMRPAIAAQLKRSLLRQFPDAKITDDIINRIIDRAAPDRMGRLNVQPNEQDLKDMGINPATLAARAESMMAGNRSAVEVGKTSLSTLALFSPSLDAAGDCVVEIRSNGKPVLLGTIVSSDGFIVTKASDLPDRITVVLPDGRNVMARIIGKDNATDLALIKVRATGLTAANFSDDALHGAPLGEFLAAPTADPNQPAIGVVSDIARPIPEKFAHFAGEQKLVLGLGFMGPSPVIGMITPNMPAEAAGLKIGDEVTQINGNRIKDSTDFLAEVKKHTTGDTITIKVLRDKKELEFNPVLGKAKATTQTSDGVGEADDFAGGKLSKRRTKFPMAIQTDTAVWADQIGGPLINLQGQTIGVTIARYDRVCTFAIPADLVEKTIAKLKTPQE